MFIHKYTRLNCDLTMAYRYFVVDKLANNWLGSECEIDLKAKIYDFKSNARSHVGTSIEEFNREEVLVLSLKDDISTKCMKVEIKFMKCASRTEYCTEVHLMHHGFETKDEDYLYYLKFWEESFDLLRKIHNRDWVISDGDLSLGILMGSRL